MSRECCGVFARPRWHDRPVIGRRFPWLMDYLMWIGDEVVFHGIEKGLCVHDLKEDDAVRSKVEDALTKYDPIFFFHASHGGFNLLTEQNESIMICCPPDPPSPPYTDVCPNPNPDVLSDRVVYTLSCLSAGQLGPAAIKAGGISYIGYKHLLGIIIIQGSEFDEIFKDIWGGGAKALINGKTTGEAYNWLKRRYNMWINYWEMKPTSYEKTIILSVLQDDLERLTLLGKKDAKISS